MTDSAAPETPDMAHHAPLTVQIGSEPGKVVLEWPGKRECLLLPPAMAMEIAVSMMKHARRAGCGAHSSN